MNIHVIVFRMKKNGFSEIYQGLEKEGILISEVQTIGKLHDVLHANTVDAVIVRNKILFLYRLHPLKHLGFAKSKTAIIGISRCENECVRAKAYTLNKDNESKSDNDQIAINKILATLHSLRVKYEKKGSISWETIFDTTNFHLHKKIGSIFELLLEAGSCGISVEKIQDQVWKAATKSKRSDIQVYITRLRKLLVVFGKDNTKIIYKNNKYYLEQLRKV